MPTPGEQKKYKFTTKFNQEPRLSNQKSATMLKYYQKSALKIFLKSI
jgi:hypothetical protein